VQGNQQETGIIAGINVTPLVDVMLVLLVIFIVTAKIIVTPAVPLDLPKAAKTEEVQVVFSVIVPEQGPVTVNGQSVPDDSGLADQARSAVGRDADLRAVIQAEGGVPHRRVVAILDALRGAGVAHIAFGALPEEPAARAR
jgi:biopolymer transport protein TolR